MRLAPTQSPGRGTRKARDFATEIVELRKQGYTLDAIRAALADAGVHVTISTVWREANRVGALPVSKAVAQTTSSPPPHPVQATQQPPTQNAAPTVARTAPSVLAERPDSKRQAELFMSTQITNPLIRSKEQR